MPHTYCTRITYILHKKLHTCYIHIAYVLHTFSYNYIHFHTYCIHTTYILHTNYIHVTYIQQQVVTLRVCANRWTEVCGGIGSQRMRQRKMAPLLKITIVLFICSIFVECRSDRVFFVICEISLKANKSQIIHNFARFVVHEWLMFRVLACARTRR